MGYSWDSWSPAERGNIDSSNEKSSHTTDSDTTRLWKIRTSCKWRQAKFRNTSNIAIWWTTRISWEWIVRSCWRVYWAWVYWIWRVLSTRVWKVIPTLWIFISSAANKTHEGQYKHRKSCSFHGLTMSHNNDFNNTVSYKGTHWKSPEHDHKCLLMHATMKKATLNRT